MKHNFQLIKKQTTVKNGNENKDIQFKRRKTAMQDINGVVRKE